MKVSVIMASFLGAYYGRSEVNRDKKFIRAVNSFLKQTYEDTELIIVSDGCEKTNKIYEENWKENPKIQLFKSVKLPTYAGGIRQIGNKMATGNIICYLDNDDVLGKNHIQTIVDQFDIEKYDWVYYNDYLVLNKEFSKFQTRYVEPRYASIGTSSIAHVNLNKYKDRFLKSPEWSSGYGHDFLFIMSLASSGMRFKKLEKNPQYFVAHTGNSDF